MLDLQSQLAPSTVPIRPRRALEDSRKLAVASVQGLDQLRKLVLPDALLGAIGGAIPGTKLVGSLREKSNFLTGGGNLKASSLLSGKREELRQALDDMLASSCVLCSASGGAIDSLDRPFVEEGEVM